MGKSDSAKREYHIFSTIVRKNGSHLQTANANDFSVQKQLFYGYQLCKFL